ncbi:hypothetical protein QM999_00840 [Pectobacterium cacticida]|uniref:hypothetical protein n=1 Tax=Pectobacterium cacticida TaxID=69221 RepID=UPI002FF31857
MMVIEPAVFDRLLALQRHLSPQGGLRMTLDDDPCSGWKVGLHWSAAFQPRDHVEMINGLRLLADPLHWTLLQNATLSAGRQNNRAGVRVVLPAVSACQCESGGCTTLPEQG